MILGDIMTLTDLDEAALSHIDANIGVKGLSADSRQIEEGFVFFALSGEKTDGSKFIEDAVSKGACAIVARAGKKISSSDIPVLYVENPRLLLAQSSAKFFGKQPRTIVAVTGTAGKTSVASFVQQIWTQVGNAAAMIGTTGVISPSLKEYGSLTTPDPVTLHGLLSELAEDEVTHCSMEASSHGLDQYRLDGVQLTAGAFTNLGRDHMDYHETVADYMNAKMGLFERVLPKGAPAVIFADDEWSEQAISAAKKSGMKVLAVGRNGSFLTLKRVEQYRHHQRAEIHFGDDIIELDLPLAGDFQMANALVAAGLCIATGSDVHQVMKALEKIEGAPGRLDLVGSTEKGAPVYVDYAHKPDALEHVLNAVRPFTTGRIILVFGCGGDRDKGKRAIMGEIASRLSDVVIVTDDNPRSENPEEIRAEILTAASSAIEIGDRSQAISDAIDMLEEGDTLLIAGKGHEHGQIIGDQVLPFSDHEEARSALEGQI